MQKEICQFFKPTNKSNKVNKVNTVNKKKDEPVLFQPNLFVFTDGACQNNGRSNATATWAVYFKKNDVI